MKRLEVHCRECHDRGLLSLGGFGGELIIFPCGCQDPDDQDSRHHKPYDCAPCGGSGDVADTVCNVCDGCGRSKEPSA